MKVIGMDPGFANFGLVSAEVSDTYGLRFTNVATFVTKPCKELSAAQDLISRIEDTHLDVACWVGGGVQVLCIEGMSHPPNSSSAVKLGASHGMAASLSSMWVPERTYVESPQHIRKTVTGDKKPTEQQAHDVLLAAHPELKTFYDTATKGARVHWMDAACAVLAWYLEEEL